MYIPTCLATKDTVSALRWPLSAKQDHKNASLFDTDPVVQRYVHALKRLVTYTSAMAYEISYYRAGNFSLGGRFLK